MSLKKVHHEQPEKFEFTQSNFDLAKKILEKYPKNRKKSAVKYVISLGACIIFMKRTLSKLLLKSNGTTKPMQGDLPFT